MKTIRALVPLALAACSAPPHPSAQPSTEEVARHERADRCPPRSTPPAGVGRVQTSFVDERGWLRSTVARSPGTEPWGACDHEDVLTSIRPAMLPEHRALRRAQPAARRVLSALVEGDFDALAREVHPGRGLLLRFSAGDPCLVLSATSVRGCTVDDRLLHCETAIHHGPPAAACQPYLKRLLHLEWFTASDTLSAACTSARQYLVRPELLPRSGAGQPLVPLVVRAIPREVRYPNEGLVMTFIEEDGRLWLHELAPAEISR